MEWYFATMLRDNAQYLSERPEDVSRRSTDVAATHFCLFLFGSHSVSRSATQAVLKTAAKLTDALDPSTMAPYRRADQSTGKPRQTL